jgi:hypothetical protein
MSYSSSYVGPRLVGYQLASESYEYMMRALDLGAFEGPIGDMKLTPQVKAILEAMHHVLAGGEVKIEVVHRGNPDIVNELNRRLAAGLDEANEINKKAGFYVTITG